MDSTKPPILSETLAALRSFFEQHAAPKYLVAVSGGRDSMLLCDLLLLLKLPIELMHVNYGLRGNESDQDQKLIEQYCQKNKLKFHCIKYELAQQLLVKKRNLQAEARAVRYRFFREMQAEEPESLICVAHHLDDQMETFWLQLARGAGLKGLAGMPSAQNKILRPLLHLKRSEINALCAALQTPFRNDSSNTNTKYRRNLWRLQLIPFLNEQLPNLQAAVQHLQHSIQKEIEDQKLQLQLAIDYLEKNKSITLKELSQLTAFQYIELFKRNGFPMYITKRIAELFTAENGKYLQWKNPVTAQMNFLVKKEKNLDWFINEPCMWAYQLKDTPRNAAPNDDLIDRDLINGPIYFRTVQPKDKIKIKGLTGSKSVYQLLKEAGVPAPLRPFQQVCCDDQKVLAVPGYKVNFAVVANAHSSKVAELTFQKILTFEND